MKEENETKKRPVPKGLRNPKKTKEEREKLNPGRRLFVAEYLKDLNGTAAAIRAGYSEKNASGIANNLLSKKVVSGAIEEAIARREEETKITADWVLKKVAETYRRLEAINNSDIRGIYNEDGTLKPISEWPEIWRTKRGIKSVEVEELFEERTVYDKRKKRAVRTKVLVGYLKKVTGQELTTSELKTLELLGRHTNVSAFSERTKVDGEVTLKVVYESPKLIKLESEERTRLEEEAKEPEPGTVTLLPKDSGPDGNDGK